MATRVCAAVAKMRLADDGQGARVILLNGPGSSGKTSIARALQAIASRPLLHLSMDDVLGMLPEAFEDHPRTFRYVTETTADGPVTTISTGPLGARLMAAFHRLAGDLAQDGFDVIVDVVWLDGEPPDLAPRLHGCRVWRVGLTAPLDVLEAREAARGDRLAGLSRAQVGRVHSGVRYDLMLDTSEMSAGTAARKIADIAGV